jgi:hydroxysqualene dehydroxylase
MKLLVAGAGWAGMAAAVRACERGHSVTLWEASRLLGGRARAVQSEQNHTLDNGQHILIAAYTDTVALMRQVGVDIDAHVLRLPCTLRFADGTGLALPLWQKPWFRGADVLVGLLRAKGWTLTDKLSLLRRARAWERAGFVCAPTHTVLDVCQGISARVMQEMIEPLVLSALNTPPDRASGQVFLRVLHDAMFAPTLLPRTDLSSLMPQAAAAWLNARGAQVVMGQRLQSIAKEEQGVSPQGQSWLATSAASHTERFDAIILATAPWDAARILRQSPIANQPSAQAWLAQADSLAYEAITTVYALSPTPLPQPMLALRYSSTEPAQFVFDRSQLLPPSIPGQPQNQHLLAFVISASQGDANTLEQQVITQAKQQLKLPALQALQTITEKRATFACHPELNRPSMQITQGLLAAGDYIQGPYPSTLEGAVQHGLAAAMALDLR